MENESNSQPPRLSIFSSIPILIIVVYNYRCSVLLAHASKINLWTLSLFSNSPMALMMEFMYAHLVDSASAQEHQVSCYGHITTYLIYRIDVVPDTQVIHLNISTTIPSNVCSSLSILIVILVGEFFLII